MSRRMRRAERPTMRKINKAIRQDAAETSASDHFPPGKKGVMAKAYKDPRTA